MNNTVIRKKPLQAIVKEFSALIGAETYNFRIKLCSDEREKLLENFVSIVFPFEEINETKSSLVVGYRVHVRESLARESPHRSG